MDYSAFGSAIEDDSDEMPVTPLRITSHTVPVSERRTQENIPLLDATTADISMVGV
jgi:hypothetical protein